MSSNVYRGDNLCKEVWALEPGPWQKARFHYSHFSHPQRSIQVKLLAVDLFKCHHCTLHNKRAVSKRISLCILQIAADTFRLITFFPPLLQLSSNSPPTLLQLSSTSPPTLLYLSSNSPPTLPIHPSQHPSQYLTALPYHPSQLHYNMHPSSITVTGSSITSLNVPYTLSPHTIIPKGFTNVCLDNKWDPASTWEKLNQGRDWYGAANGAYIYLNGADGMYWMDSPDGMGKFVAREGGGEKIVPKDGWKPLPGVEGETPKVDFA